jgi:hypothetical protein
MPPDAASAGDSHPLGRRADLQVDREGCVLRNRGALLPAVRICIDFSEFCPIDATSGYKLAKP